MKRDDGSYLISGWMPALWFADLLDIAAAGLALLSDLCRLPAAGVRHHSRRRRQDRSRRLAIRDCRSRWKAHRQGAREQNGGRVTRLSAAGNLLLLRSVSFHAFVPRRRAGPPSLLLPIIRTADLLGALATEGGGSRWSLGGGFHRAGNGNSYDQSKPRKQKSHDVPHLLQAMDKAASCYLHPLRGSKCRKSRSGDCQPQIGRRESECGQTSPVRQVRKGQPFQRREGQRPQPGLSHSATEIVRVRGR